MTPVVNLKDWKRWTLKKLTTRVLNDPSLPSYGIAYRHENDSCSYLKGKRSTLKESTIQTTQR